MAKKSCSCNARFRSMCTCNIPVKKPTYRKVVPDQTSKLFIDENVMAMLKADSQAFNKTKKK